MQITYVICGAPDLLERRQRLRKVRRPLPDARVRRRRHRDEEEIVRRTTIALASLALATGLTLTLAAGRAAAKDGDILVAGRCTQSSTSKLKLSEENGRIEVEFEVDPNRNGVRWTVVLSRDGRRIARLARTTRPPSGSFEARIVTANRAGADVISGRAVSPSGEICRARATFS
jgi:hypothetical protein